MKNFFYLGRLKTEDEIREYIKDYAEWDDVAEKMIYFLGLLLSRGRIRRTRKNEKI